ncbi:GTPase Era [Mycoplasmopsis opalescens]|uniref:GTPase Era n=1 Tax=Mycoplasmopsis opalescens TaxID=114886 RepID=UPI0004A6F81B|nr:GTPase Era [Mycoplasmopsis opalescens]
MRVALVSIIGRPNVGKSSLMNKIISYEASIVSNVPQTTRDQITGIYNEDNYQIVFLDTPGIHKPLNMLGEALNKNAYDTLKGSDALLFLTPINEKIGKGDQLILEKISKFPYKIAVLTKIDLANNPDLIANKIKDLEAYNFDHVISVSIKNDKSIDQLIELLKKYTYEGDPFYDPEYITDKSMRFIAREIIRESAINNLRDELPHSIAVEVNEFNEDFEDKIIIEAIIYVKKASQKGMVIGAGGQKIKTIGMQARRKIMAQFATKVELNLKVKIANKWINDPKTLKKFGY